MAFLVGFYFISLRILRIFLSPVLALLYRSRKKAIPAFKYGWLKMSATDLAEKIRNKEVNELYFARIKIIELYLLTSGHVIGFNETFP